MPAQALLSGSLCSLYVKFQPSCFGTEGGDIVDRQRDGRTYILRAPVEGMHFFQSTNNAHRLNF